MIVPLIINDKARPANSGRWELTVGDGKGILIPNGPGILGSPETYTGTPGPATAAGPRAPSRSARAA